MPSDKPTTLYHLSIAAAVRDNTADGKFAKKEFRVLPDHVLFDFYFKMYLDKRLCLLAGELGNLEVFLRMLRVKHKRAQLLRCFQELIDHCGKIVDDVTEQYEKRHSVAEADWPDIDLGLRIGVFFSEGSWFKHAHAIFNIVESMCKMLKKRKNVQALRRLLDCYHRRIFVESSFCMFEDAENTIKLANKVVEELAELKLTPNLSGLYANFSNMYSIRNEYDEAYNWSIKAIKLLEEDLPVRVIIEVLRQASKACVFKRRFPQAQLLIQQAVLLAEQLYQLDSHPSYSDALMDYGFYMLNTDNIEESVKFYKQAVGIRREVFGKNNFHVATGYEELAYAVYVNEYSSGKFYDAREYIENAINIMERLLPKNHLALAGKKRVKALILEEIAVDMREPALQASKQKYLQWSEELHKSALKMSLAAFGERNVQTAKHYGNLGRLYQSMSLYEKAEQMHLRAIAIKEELLGAEDFEVGLSLGHLASLYNFHMKRYRDAEKIYLRSISISRKLFGPLYSGLEYDYRGIIKVYTELQEVSELMHYTQTIREWKSRRLSLTRTQSQPTPMALGRIVDHFISLC